MHKGNSPSPCRDGLDKGELMMNAQKTWIQKYLFVFWGLSAACAVNGTAEAADDRTYVYQTVAAATLGEGTESWDDGTTLAQSGKHYVLDVEKIEGATSASISMPTSINTTGAAHQFRGESLTLNSGCSLKFPVTGVDDITFKCKELNLNDGSFLGMVKKSYYTIAGGKMNVSGTVQVWASSGRYVRLKSAISGDENSCLKFCGFDSGTAAYATYFLRADNSNFKGVIDMTRHKSTEASFGGKFSILDIDHADRLGGNLSVLNRKSIILTHYAQLRLANTILDGTELILRKASNRGIAVTGKAQINVVKKSVTFTIETPLSLNGELRQLGAGTLVLKGDAIGFGSDGLSEEPTEGKNIFSVTNGTLAIGSVDAINGAAVTFKKGSKFELRPNFDDAEFMKYGIRNVKTSTPFALGEEVEALPFSIGTATGTPPFGVPFRLGLFTVKSDSESVELIRSAVAEIEYPVVGFKAKVVEDVDEVAGTVTFAIDYAPIGLRISIR